MILSDKWMKIEKEVQIDIVAGTTDKGTFGKGKTYIYYIFSKGGFTQNLEELEKKGAVHLISLEMLYE